MKIISHRGNITGSNKKLENNPEFIIESLNLGFDVEIDVWYINDKLFLGHDLPQYPVLKTFLQNKSFWCHAKNIEALNFMLKNDIHCFWHQEDRHTLTSKGYIWTYPNNELTENSICVMPEIQNISFKKNNIFGICTDYPILYKEKINEF